LAERVISTFEIVGECSGKMRSTPCPNDTLRTVKGSARPAAVHADDHTLEHLDAFLSPSRTLTCTLTVSPDFIAAARPTATSRLVQSRS